MLTVGVTGARAAATTGTFTLKVSPSKTNVPLKKIILAGTWDTIPGMLMPPVPKLISIKLPNAILDKRALKGTDTLSSVQKIGRCSKSKYRMGRFTATGHAAPLIPTLEVGGDICFVKTVSGSVFSVALAMRYDPLGIIIAIPANIKVKGGSVVIEVDTSTLFELVAGQSASVSKMRATVNRNPKAWVKGRVKGKKKKVNKRIYLLKTPAKCVNKVWSGSQVTTFFDADPLTATTTTKCKQTKKKKKKSKKKK